MESGVFRTKHQLLCRALSPHLFVMCIADATLKNQKGEFASYEVLI